MKTILSASKSVENDTIHVIEELEVEQLKRNIIFQYPERSKNDRWLEHKIANTVFSRIVAENTPHLIMHQTSAVRCYSVPATILISYDVIR